MHGEETGRLCRDEVNGQPATPNRVLSIRQVDGANAVGIHRRGEMNRNTRLRARTSTAQRGVHTRVSEVPVSNDVEAVE